MLVESLKKTILQSAITGKLVPQNEEDESIRISLNKILQENETSIESNKIKRENKLKPIGIEEIPFEIPSSWEWVKLGEIGSWQSGLTPSRGNAEYFTNGTIPWLKTGDLNNGLITKTSECITELAVKETSIRLNKKGSVLIAMYGATIGKVGILDIDATTNQACCACSLFGNLNNKYLFYYLMSQREKFISKGVGGAQPNISKEKIINTIIPLPPIKEQQRIVEKIEELMIKIDEFEKIENELEIIRKNFPEDMKKSLLQAAIEGKLVEQNTEDETVDTILDKIKKEINLSKINEKDISHEIPNSWKWVRLGDIAYLRDGCKISNKKYVYLEAKYLRGKITGNIKDMGHFVKKGTYVILVDGENSGEVFITNEDGYLGSTFKVLEINQNLYNEYVLMILKKYQSYFKNSKKGAAIPHLDKTLFKSLLIPLPPLEEQKRIVEKFNQLTSHCEALVD